MKYSRVRDMIHASYFNMVQEKCNMSYYIDRIIEQSSVQFSRSVVSDSLRPNESQHARPPCPSPSPGVHSNSCPLSR